METVTPATSSIGRAVPAGYYTRGQAAILVGRSKDTLRRWHESGIFVATHTATFGELNVWLYSEEDLSKLHEITKRIHPGPKKKHAV